ncbi:hypothetical protein AB0I72_19790 [Nocardiopsis sp. NPDC049922]|uniref:hypothetical protein n=1 Tax=Nocardiopsis sp. NPDC049922 TaxID=3155157 RepID=UPI0033E5367C
MSTMSPLERRIHSNRQRARRRAIAEGRPTTTKVDAAPAREHAERLRAIGISTARLAELSEVPLATVRHILYGTGGHPPAKRTEQDHLDRILAVPAVPLLGAPGAFIDACGTVRRLQALIAAGWSVAELARRLAVFPPNLAQMLQRSQVRVTTALAVRRLYDELWDVEPPQDTPRQRRAVREARERAARAGWPTPAGWDDDDIDLPKPDLTAKHAAQVAAMDDTQLGAYNRAAYREGERSPLIRAAAAEYSRRAATAARERQTARTRPEEADR